MTKDEALKLALRSLKELAPDDSDYAPALQGQRKRQQNAITAVKKALAAPVQEPMGWISNKDFEPIRIRIMQEAYELADSNNPEGYNAIKVMCGDVQKMLSPQRTWVGLTDEEIVLIVAECAASHQHTDIHFAKAIEAKLKQKNGYAEEKNT